MSDEQVKVTMTFAGTQAVLDDDHFLRWTLSVENCRIVADALLAAADGMEPTDVVDVRGQG